MRSDKARGGKEVGGGVGAELDERRAVRRAAVEEGRLERLRAIGGGGGEKAGVEHGRVAERVWRGVSAGEESPGLGCQYRGLHGYKGETNIFRLLDHGGDDGLWGADGLVEFPPKKPPLLCRSLRVHDRRRDLGVDRHRR